MHTLIKICGLTEPAEAAIVNENDVDLAGNVLFFEKSRRNIDIRQARRIHAELKQEIKKVAVVVSPTIDHLLQIEEAGFDLVQIHGELPDWEQLLERTRIQLLLAYNQLDVQLPDDALQMERIEGFLFDAACPGSGQVFDWNVLADLMQSGQIPGQKPVFLAGGLTPENVAGAMRIVGPAGVDVSSGVEYADRQGKDPAAIRRFAAAVRRADAQKR